MAYAKKVVFPKLLMTFCFEPQSKNRTITDLFKSVNFYGFDMLYEIELDLFEFLRSFKKNLEKDELTALYFWVLNQKYLCYLENFKCGDDTCSEKEFDREFGRYLAYKIYEPNDNGLDQDMNQELKLLLCDFASEFDLSVIDRCTLEQIVEGIDVYWSICEPGSVAGVN